MRKRHVITYFRDVPQAELVPIVNAIVDAMTINKSVFPTPTPPLAEITKMAVKYNDILGSSEHAGRKAEIYEARTALEEGLKTLGDYVNSIANGDEVILEKSGFPLSKIPSPHGDIDAPSEAGVEIVSGGFAIWASLVDRSYNGVLFAFTEVSNPERNPYNWTIRYSSVPKITLTGLFKRGTEYKFAAAFVGTGENVHWKVISETMFAN